MLEFQQRIKRFWQDREGAVALVFALCIPMFIGAAGIAVDLAQAYNVKNRLANALDKAALAAGSSTGTEEEIRERVEAFFEANYPFDVLGVAYDLQTLIDSDGVVTVSAKATVETTFMSILGQEYVHVWAESAVKREMAGVEVVLVLDVTGSMAGNNITALKYASNSFLNIMFSRISDPEFIKIGLVPFSQTVNVGRYGLGQTSTGAFYDTAFVDRPATDDYVNPASNIQYGTTGSTTWRGCIRERNYPLDTTDDSSPNWGMYRYPKICSKYKNGSCSSWSNNNANTNCPASRVVPLTNSKTTLQSAINGLQTGGNTYGNVGMAWGYHVLTPDFPFQEGVDLDDPDWNKVVIMMTDGDNTVNNTYSAYGSSPGISVTDLNNRFEEICTNMKNEGITIYTVTFQSGITDATRDIFRRCASEEDKYFNAPSNDDLTYAFETIANQLSQLHIVR